jgi:hypothetical protein
MLSLVRSGRLDGLTWAGHESLEARDDTRWGRAKGVMKDKSGGMVFERAIGIRPRLMSRRRREENC